MGDSSCYLCLCARERSSHTCCGSRCRRNNTCESINNRRSVNLRLNKQVVESLYIIRSCNAYTLEEGIKLFRVSSGGDLIIIDGFNLLRGKLEIIFQCGKLTLVHCQLKHNPVESLYV